MILKKISFILACLLSCTAFAQNDNSTLAVYNKTDKDSTFKIGNQCSVVLGNVGVTRAHHLGNIPLATLGSLCSDTKKCDADVYVSNDCSGSSIGTITFNVDTGITDISTDEEAKFAITGHQLDLFVRQFS